MRPATVHVCPHCEKVSVEGSAFVIPDVKPEMIDGFRFCSNQCRHYAQGYYPRSYTVKRINGGQRSETFRSDRRDP